MKREKNRRGFTLIELVVVLAILAIVAAVAVPVAFGSLEKARTAACAASRSDLLSALRTQTATQAVTTGTTKQVDAAAALATAQKACANCGVTLTDSWTIAGVCPEGGTYTIKYNTATGLYSITCSDPNHAELITGLSGADLFYQKIADKTTELAKLIASAPNKNGQIDSTAPNKGGLIKGNTEKIKDLLLNTYGIDLTGSSWTIKLNNGVASLYYTESDISSLASGATVTVTRWNGASGEKTTGTIKVTKPASQYGNYNILNVSSFKAD